MTILGIFPGKVKDIIFMQDEIEPMQGEIETNIRKFGNSEKLKFPFWVEGTFGDDIGGWEQEIQIGLGVVGTGEAMAGSQMRQGVCTKSARWQGREGMVGAGGRDGSCWG